MNSTFTAGWNGMWLTPDTNKPEKTPEGLIVTRAVETQDGWRGQILVDKEIVFETEATNESQDALAAVNIRVVTRIKKLFA